MEPAIILHGCVKHINTLGECSSFSTGRAWVLGFSCSVWGSVPHQVRSIHSAQAGHGTLVHPALCIELSTTSSERGPLTQHRPGKEAVIFLPCAWGSVPHQVRVRNSHSPVWGWSLGSSCHVWGAQYLTSLERHGTSDRVRIIMSCHASGSNLCCFNSCSCCYVQPGDVGAWAKGFPGIKLHMDTLMPIRQRSSSLS